MRSTHRLPLLLSAGIAGLMLTALPFGFDGATFSAVATQAWAGAENGHGNGQGNGNANGHDKHAEKDKSQDADDDGDDDEADASDLGALNAAHASPQALAHANPNSRVGKIAAYKEAELAAKSVAADAATADQAVADAQSGLADAEATRDGLVAAADTDGDGTLSDTEQAAMTQEQKDALAAADQAVSDAEAAVANAQAAAETVDAAAAAAQDEADAALVNASNKDITDDDGNVLTDVRDAVNDLLGID
jgi:hypothetical protein